MTSTIHFGPSPLVIKAKVYGRSKELPTWACLTLGRDKGEQNLFVENPDELDQIAAAVQKLATEFRIAQEADALADRLMEKHGLSKETLELVS